MVYHVLVHGYQSNAGQFSLEVDHLPQSCVPDIDCHPSNDSCSDAFPVQSGTIMADNTGAGTSIPETSCAESTGRDLWYSYTNPSPYSIEVTVQAGGATPTLYAYDSPYQFLACRGTTSNGAYVDRLGPGQSILLRVVSPTTYMNTEVPLSSAKRSST